MGPGALVKTEVLSIGLTLGHGGGGKQWVLLLTYHKQSSAARLIWGLAGKP